MYKRLKRKADFRTLNLHENYYNNFQSKPSDFFPKTTNTFEKLVLDRPCNALFATEAMVPLSTLDSADVKADQCPLCKTMLPLEHICGFKVCPNCGVNYKCFDNKAYVIDYLPNELKNMSLDEIVLRNSFRDNY